ncbi:MAG: HEAT repeat domain-containing protein [Planctomycetota bacterium]
MFTMLGRRECSMLLWAVTLLVAHEILVVDRVALASDREITSGEGSPVISKERLAKAAKALDEALKGGSSAAIVHLVWKSDKEEKQAIFEVLARRIESDPDPEIRARCVNGMRAFDKGGAEVIAKALASDPEVRVRGMAVRVLQSVGTEEEVEVLIEAITTNRSTQSEWEIAEQAVVALGLIGGERAKTELRRIWENQAAPFGERRAALIALAEAGDLSSLETMKETLKSDNDALKRTSIVALMVMAMRFSEDLELVASIRTITLELLRSTDPEIREMAALSVGNIGKREDIPLLEQLLEDPHTTEGSYTENGEVKRKTLYPVRKAAAEAIGRINKRYPPEEKPSASAGNHESKAALTSEPNEPAGEPSPAATGPEVARYILAATAIGIVIAAAIILTKKKHANIAK